MNKNEEVESNLALEFLKQKSKTLSEALSPFIAVQPTSATGITERIFKPRKGLETISSLIREFSNCVNTEKLSDGDLSKACNCLKDLFRIINNQTLGENEDVLKKVDPKWHQFCVLVIDEAMAYHVTSIFDRDSAMDDIARDIRLKAEQVHYSKNTF